MRLSKLAPTLVLSLLSVLAFSTESESHGRVHYYPYYSAWPYWGGYYGYPAFYYGGFYGAPYPYAHTYYSYSDRAPSAVRLEVKPVEAEVYVDGYLAGIVDEFDGFFQRLDLTPGAHEIVIYLDGHRTIRGKALPEPPGYFLQASPRDGALRAGESNGARPEPPARARARAPPDRCRSRPASSAPVSGFGVLELHVPAGDSEVVIDGTPSPSPGAPEPSRLASQPGEHRVEIEKRTVRLRDRRPHRSRQAHDPRRRLPVRAARRTTNDQELCVRGRTRDYGHVQLLVRAIDRPNQSKPLRRFRRRADSSLRNGWRVCEPSRRIHRLVLTTRNSSAASPLAHERSCGTTSPTAGRSSMVRAANNRSTSSSARLVGAGGGNSLRRPRRFPEPSDQDRRDGDPDSLTGSPSTVRVARASSSPSRRQTRRSLRRGLASAIPGEQATASSAPSRLEAGFEARRPR